MQPETSNTDSDRRSTFIESLSAFGRQHRAQHWEGTFGDFLHNILPTNPAAFTRASHQYIWDMLRWYGRERTDDDDTARAQELFRPELFGINEPLARVVDYFKAAAAGSPATPTNNEGQEASTSPLTLPDVQSIISRISGALLPPGAGAGGRG